MLVTGGATGLGKAIAWYAQAFLKPISMRECAQRNQQSRKCLVIYFRNQTSVQRKAFTNKRVVKHFKF